MMQPMHHKRRKTRMHHLQLMLLLLLSAAASLQSIHASHEFPADGTVLELDESNFDSAISSFHYVLVDFYAPWCGHCKSLSPELDVAAPILASLDEPVVIAKVDADKFRTLASKYEVDGFPTLKLFIHGVPVDYSGPRKAGLLVRTLRKLVEPDVSVLKSDSSVSRFVKEAGADSPIFIGFGLDESSLAGLALKYKEKAWFSVAKDFSEEAKVMHAFDEVPALVCLHARYDERSVFYGPFEDELLEDFIKKNQLPLLVPMNYETLLLLRDDERKIVLTIMEDELDEKSLELIKKLKDAASINHDLVFGYVGLKQWEDFAYAFEVGDRSELPKIVVWDASDRYFIVVGSESIDEEDDQSSQISQFLEGYRQGNTVQKRLRGHSLFNYIGSLTSARVVYIILFAVAGYMLLGNMCVPSKDDILQKKQTQVDGDANGSATAESRVQKECRPEDKED